VGIEIAFYWLCKRRGVVLEGASGDETAAYFLIIFGMLLPVFIGYLAYERSRYVAPYHNTLRITKAEKDVHRLETAIVSNEQKMLDHFKRELHDTWTVQDEFRIYKENYNEKHGIRKENLEGHFCENYECFEKEAMQRYTKDVLQQTLLQPTVIITKEQLNGRTKELPQTTINH
jgi:hypothetical protein